MEKAILVPHSSFIRIRKISANTNIILYNTFGRNMIIQIFGGLPVYNFEEVGKPSKPPSVSKRFPAELVI